MWTIADLRWFTTWTVERYAVPVIPCRLCGKQALAIYAYCCTYQGMPWIPNTLRISHIFLWALSAKDKLTSNLIIWVHLILVHSLEVSHCQQKKIPHDGISFKYANLQTRMETTPGPCNGIVCSWALWYSQTFSRSTTTSHTKPRQS